MRAPRASSPPSSVRADASSARGPVAASEALLEVEALDVERSGRLVLSDVSMMAERGDLVALVGPNGAGKSTLLAALLGLIPVASGRIAAAPLAYVPQSAPGGRAFPLTALDVALMGAYARLRPFRRTRRTELDRAREALERVRLGDPNARYDELSAGQRTRALVARALVQAGEVLLLDEPLSDVDVTSARAILEALDEERAQGRAVVMATHDLGFARDAATRVVLLNGRVFASGPPAAALTVEALAAAYGARLMLVGDGLREAFDEGSHHDHPR
jgi:ABC-type Mn2+/Zn2+ transport system ATPase subunit